MLPPSSSWLHETWTLTRRYILIGIALIPAGIAYAVWVIIKGESQFIMVSCIALDLVLVAAISVWTGPKTKKVRAQTVSPALAAALAGPIAEHWSTLHTQTEQEDLLVNALCANREGRHQLVTLRETDRYAAGVLLERLHDRIAIRARQPEMVQGADAAHAALSSVSR